MKTHILAKFGQRPFKCDYELCEYSSTTKQNLESHRKRIHINPIEACKLCGKKTRHIDEHMRRIHPDTPDVLSFDNQSKMADKHIDKHLVVLPIVCEICDLECDSDGAKNEHKMKMHNF